MNIETNNITLSEAWPYLLAAVGIIGAWFTRAADTRNSEKRHADLEIKVGGIDAELEKLKLHGAETYVRRDDLDKLEERLGKMISNFVDGVGRRMDIIEHSVRNVDTKLLSIVQLSGRKGSNE